MGDLDIELANAVVFKFGYQQGRASERERIRQELQRRIAPFRLQLRDVSVDAVEWARIEVVLDGDTDG